MHNVILGWLSSVDAEPRKMFAIFYGYKYVSKQLKTPKEIVKYSRLQLRDGCWCGRLYVSLCMHRDKEHGFPIRMNGNFNEPKAHEVFHMR